MNVKRNSRKNGGIQAVYCSMINDFFGPIRKLIGPSGYVIVYSKQYHSFEKYEYLDYAISRYFAKGRN